MILPLKISLEAFSPFFFYYFSPGHHHFLPPPWQLAPKCLSCLKPVSSIDHAPYCYHSSSLKTYIWSFSSTQKKNFQSIWKSKFNNFSIICTAPLPVLLLPLCSPNHLSGITSYYISSNIIHFGNSHLSIFCLILLKLGFDCFISPSFIFETKCMLISTCLLFKPNHSEHPAQIRSGGGERDWYLVYF